MAGLLIYGVIGDPADRLDARTVVDQIRAASGDLEIRINSPGGFVADGLAIYQALATYDRGAVTIYIDALAASIASVIAMAAPVRIMAQSAMAMIHKPWNASIGNADELRKDAALLDKIEQQLVNIYSRVSGQQPETISAWLSEEVWFDADEALAAGFVTAISEPLKLAAMADVSAYGFRHTPQNLGGNAMPEVIEPAAAVTAERQRIAGIMSMCAKHGVADAARDDMIAKGTALDQARGIVLDALATRQDAENIGGNGPIIIGQQTFDNPAFAFTAMQDALVSRMTGAEPKGAARDMIGLSLTEMARNLLERRGVAGARNMAPVRVMDAWNGYGKGRASQPRAEGTAGWLGSGAITHGSGDFPDLLTSTGNRVLEAEFKRASSKFKVIARKSNFRDFRSRKSIVMSDFSMLDDVAELGELKYGTFSTRGESYKPREYGKLFSLSRQAIINDDLSAFSDVLRLMGLQAAQTETMILATLLISNPIMSDGNALFSAAHGNLIASGSGGPPTVASFDAARVKLATQKDPNSGSYLEVEPFAWVGPTVLGGAARVVNGSQYDPDVANKLQRANIALGMLEHVLDAPQLTSQTAWYLFADPNLAPVLEYGYVNDQEEPQLDSREGWNVLGMEYRVVHDFGAGVVDWRGAIMNAGA